ncbi:MAG TPA: beta-glucosidase, partial [Candidatus Tetragenococcus pullicola]|nr:beta-glucosidase [Candidatus Tetragenococcus pullicola]
MNKEKLDRLFSTLSFEEKVGQMIQLTGDFFNIDERIMETGPLKKLGLHDNFEPFNVGSVLNVTDSKNVVELQTEYLKRAKHRIPLLFMADVIYGYKSIFPIPLAQTCSWNFDLIEKSAQVIAKECYDAGIHVTFSPMVDVARDARWGRVMESPGEDVLLAKKYAEHMVRGIQGNREMIGENHIAACVKHFAAYGAPTAGRE